MLDDVVLLSSLTDCESQLLEAVQSGERCEFTDGVRDVERTVRADVLKVMLLADGQALGIGASSAVDLSGALVSGDLTGFDGTRLRSIRLEGCSFDHVDFSGATFTGDTSFNQATFGRGGEFNGAIFNREVSFHEAIFTEAQFREAKFKRNAWFAQALFTHSAEFNRATFNREAKFSDTIFVRAALLGGTTFNGNASFTGATFTGPTRFDDATFNRVAGFSSATFTGEALFDGATFASGADFRSAIANELSFKRVTFCAPDPGPWIASMVSLERAVMSTRGRVSITAITIDATRFQATEGAHLVVHCPKVKLGESEFLRPSIVASLAATAPIPHRPKWKAPTDPSPRDEVRAEASEQARILRVNLAREFAAWKISSAGVSSAKVLWDQREGMRRALEAVHATPRSGVTSLKRANIGELVLTNIVLDECEFSGAQGLDKLQIGPGCSFQTTPRWLGWRRLGRRSILAEELRWRQAIHTGSTKTGDRPLSTPDIAEIYRSLRKGLEEGKNEPGAADFYYGEMEMRRLAGRKLNNITASHQPTPSWAERLLLNGYWAVSGYGLRASRGLTAFAVIVLAAALLYTHPFFATAPPPAPQITAVDLTTGTVSYTQPCKSATNSQNGTQSAVGKQPCPRVKFGPALDFSARESISLLQARSTTTLDATTAGMLLDFFLRLAGPALLAFTVLALRARIKR